MSKPRIDIGTRRHLERGQECAWTLTAYMGVMDGLSIVHRYYENDRTYCGARVPQGEKRMFGVLPNMPICGECANYHAQDTTLYERGDSDAAA
jgi:hypothetical protein